MAISTAVSVATGRNCSRPGRPKNAPRMLQKATEQKALKVSELLICELSLSADFSMWKLHIYTEVRDMFRAVLTRQWGIAGEVIVGSPVIRV